MFRHQRCMIEAGNVYHMIHKWTIAIYLKVQHKCQPKTKTNPSQDVCKTKTIPQNQVSNHTKDSMNTDNNRLLNTKPKVQQVANHLTNY